MRPLKDLLGQQVVVSGLAWQFSHPAPDESYLMLKDVKVWPCGSDVRYDDDHAIRFDHIWTSATLEQFDGKMLGGVYSISTVTRYVRKNGSVDYGVAFSGAADKRWFDMHDLLRHVLSERRKGMTEFLKAITIALDTIDEKVAAGHGILLTQANGNTADEVIKIWRDCTRAMNECYSEGNRAVKRSMRRKFKVRTTKGGSNGFS